VTVDAWCLPLPSLPSSPQNAGTTSGPAVFGGAIESEHASRPVRQWENDREELEALVLGADGPEFARARTEGRLLSIAEAAGLDAR
jgi:hypothetical protein